MFALPLLLLLWSARPGEGQAPPGPPAPSRVVGGFVDVSSGIARVHGRTSPFLGVGVALAFSDNWSAGGAGSFLLAQVPVSTSSVFHGYVLRMGYGGLTFEWTPRRRSALVRAARGDLSPSVRLLAGAGHAEITDPVAGGRLQSSNFLVLEPSLALEAFPARRVSPGITVGYRVVGGVDGLGDLGEGDLRGLFAGVVLRLGPF